MPELPDLELYVQALQQRARGQPLREITILDPFVLRTVAPPIGVLVDREVHEVRRIGKRLILSFNGDLHLAIHLMVAGRLRWLEGPPPAKPRALASLCFDTGTLLLTEAGTTRRAAMHVVSGSEGLRSLDRGGLEVFSIDLATFAGRLTSENHTVKRALTDPRLFAGIGNAYSDEILHRARLSPVVLTSRLAPDEVERLYESTRAVLSEWTVRLREKAGSRFPEKVTAFHPEMAVHGKYRQPCPVCGAPVQRIRYAANETNYCARCQTGGRLLADRALSRLLKQDWPRSIDESDR